jgi:hypothetical protein
LFFLKEALTGVLPIKAPSTYTFTPSISEVKVSVWFVPEMIDAQPDKIKVVITSVVSSIFFILIPFKLGCM